MLWAPILLSIALAPSAQDSGAQDPGEPASTKLNGPAAAAAPKPDDKNSAPNNSAPNSAPNNSAPNNSAPNNSALAKFDVASALDELIASAREPARVAVLPIKNGSATVSRRMESALLRGLIEAGLEPVTPATVKNVLGARILDVNAGNDLGPVRELSADHILLTEILDGNSGVTLRLLHVETGAVVGQVVAVMPGDSSKSIGSMRAGVGRVLDEIVVSIAQRPAELRLTQVAVAPFDALDDSTGAIRIERVVRAQIEEGLIRRGFLVVDRQRMDALGDQLELGQLLDEKSGPRIGKILGAQTFIFGTIADAGDYFLITARIVDASTAKTLGAASANVRRAGAVTLASNSIETRTPGEALFRSAIAPGWGQAYNRSPLKSVLFGGVTYGSLVVTAGLAVTGAVLAASYDGYTPPAGATPEEYTPVLRNLRNSANGFYVAAGIGAGVTALAWSLNVGDAFLSARE